MNKRQKKILWTFAFWVFAVFSAYMAAGIWAAIATWFTIWAIAGFIELG